jgi:L-fuconolactonase
MAPSARNSPFWADGMSRIAGERGAFCKFSGLVTEANGGWTVDDLRPCASHLLEAFGPDRFMWGSDWPVCLLRASYHERHQPPIALPTD